MSASWKFELLTSWDEVLSSAFWNQWEAWYRAATIRHIFFSPALARVWLETYLPLRNLQPRYLIARSEAGTVFLPLVLWRRNWKGAGQRVIVPVGDCDYDYHDPLVIGTGMPIDWAGFWSALSGQLVRDADVVRIDGIRLFCADPEDHHLHASDCAPLIDLQGCLSGEEYLRTLKKEIRQDILRRERRLQERGACCYRVFGPGEVPDALHALEVALAHHRKRWPAAYKAPGFHERLVAAALPTGELLFTSLEITGTGIGWQLSFVDGPVLRHYMPVHDQAYRAYGIGNILRYRDLEHAIGCGMKAMDLLRGAEEYKTQWCTSTTELHRFDARSRHALSICRNWAVEVLRPRLGL